MFEVERIGDMVKLLAPSSTNQALPTKITLDLSEDRSFYYTKIYIDIYDKSNDHSYEGCIECRSRIPSFVEDFRLVYNNKDGESEIFTIEIPD